MKNVYICSNRTDDAMWHLTSVRESRGSRTGRLLRTYLVTLCSGRQLGGAWGQSQQDFDLPPNNVCSVCLRVARKGETD